MDRSLSPSVSEFLYRPPPICSLPIIGSREPSGATRYARRAYQPFQYAARGKLGKGSAWLTDHEAAWRRGAVLQPSLLHYPDQPPLEARFRGAAVRYASVGTDLGGRVGHGRGRERPRTGPVGAAIPAVQAGFSPLTCTLGCLLAVAFATRLSLSVLGAVGSECTLSPQVNSPVRRIGILDTRTGKERLEPSMAMPGRLDRRCAQPSPGRRPWGF